MCFLLVFFFHFLFDKSPSGFLAVGISDGEIHFKEFLFSVDQILCLDFDVDCNGANECFHGKEVLVFRFEVVSNSSLSFVFCFHGGGLMQEILE